MRHSKLTRWILALIMFAAACFPLSQTPQLQNFAALLWLLGLGLMITALVLAVVRSRRRSSRTRR
ncbi:MULTISPECIES: hypothetical protein [unclassified Brevibacterium]|uniref:hypothetical protein n=1 Tax=unclassified Brevibacterium TaxID=2614124 RepID=UPI0010931599|nr:hypothetical protein [Brevibacterium sp. S22]